MPVSHRQGKLLALPACLQELDLCLCPETPCSPIAVLFELSRNNLEMLLPFAAAARLRRQLIAHLLAGSLQGYPYIARQANVSCLLTLVSCP